MNTTSCPPNMASDYLFGFPTSDAITQPSCEVNVTAILTFMGILIFLKTMTVIYLIYKNAQRNTYLTTLGRTAETRKVSIATLTTGLFVFLYVILTTSLVVPQLWENSACMTAYGLGTAILGINLSFRLRKVELIDNKLQNSATTRKKIRAICLQILSLLQFATFTGVVIASLVGLSYRGNRSPSQAMLACLCTGLFLHMIRIAAHYSHVIFELRMLQTDQNKASIARQLQRFRSELLFAITTLTMSFTILTAIIIWPSIWLVMSTIGVEAISVLCILLIQNISVWKYARQVLAVKKSRQDDAMSFVGLISRVRIGGGVGGTVTSQHDTEVQQRFILHKQVSLLENEGNGVEVDLEQVMEEAKDAEVVEDSHDLDVSILTLHTVFINDRNTIFARVMGFVPQRLLKTASKVKSPIQQRIIVSVGTLIGETILALITTGVISPAWSFIQLAMFVIMVIFMSATIDASVAKRVLVTSWFQVRILSNFLAVGLLGDIFNGDMRIAVLPALLAAPVFTYLGDALVPAAESSRVSVALSHLLTAVIVACLLQFDVVSNGNNRILHFNDYATYSVYQLCRDLFTSNSFFCAFYVYECWGRTTSRRLTHVGVKVWKLVKQCDLSDIATTQPLVHGPLLLSPTQPTGASHVEIRSGYFVRKGQSTFAHTVGGFQPTSIAHDGHDETSPPPVVVPTPAAAAARHVVLDAIILKELDSIPVNLIGVKRGIAVLHFVKTKLLPLVFCAPFCCLLVLVLVVGSYSSPDVCYLLVPFIVVFVAREVGMMSRTVALLLQKRNDFWVALFFSIVWVTLMTIVMPRDARLAIVWFCFCQVMFDSMSDAHLTARKQYIWVILTSIEKLVTGCVFLVLAVYMFLRSPALLEKTLDVEFVTVNFRPDITSRPGVGFSDLPAVLDVTQMAADLTLGFGIRYCADAIAVHFPGNRGKFKHIKAPVRKRRTSMVGLSSKATGGGSGIGVRSGQRDGIQTPPVTSTGMSSNNQNEAAFTPTTNTTSLQVISEGEGGVGGTSSTN